METTSTTLLWILAYLLHHPEVGFCFWNKRVQWFQFWLSNSTHFWVLFQVQERVQKELDEQVGSERLVSVSDRSQLPYLECVINEGMRIRPVSPVLIPHTALTDSR